MLFSFFITTNVNITSWSWQCGLIQFFLITHTHLYLRYSIKLLICDKCQTLKVQHITCELILSYKIHKMVYINTFVVDLKLHTKH
jgi:hypothetical protein